MSGLTIETLENALQAWVRTVIPQGWTAIWDEQNAPKTVHQVVFMRGDPYIRKVGRDEYGPILSNGSRKILGTREISLSIRTLGRGAVQLAEDIRARLDDETVADVLIAGNIGVKSTGDVRNLTNLYGSQYKEVADFEVVLRTHSLRESNDAESSVGYIETVDLDMIINPGAGQTVDTIHVARPAGP